MKIIISYCQPKHLPQYPEKAKKDEKELGNLANDTTEIELLREKIENLSKATEICKSHRKVFFKLGGLHIRIYWYKQLCSYLEKAGLTLEEIKAIQSQEAIQLLLEQAKQELQAKLGLSVQ